MPRCQVVPGAEQQIVEITYFSSPPKDGMDSLEMITCSWHIEKRVS